MTAVGNGLMELLSTELLATAGARCEAALPWDTVWPFPPIIFQETNQTPNIEFLIKNTHKESSLFYFSGVKAY